MSVGVPRRPNSGTISSGKHRFFHTLVYYIATTCELLYQLLQRMKKCVRQCVPSKTSEHFRGDVGRAAELPKGSMDEGNSR